MSADEDRLRDDAAAWVLGALERGGGARVRAGPWRRRASCARGGRGAARALRTSLPFAADPVGPPPELRDADHGRRRVRGASCCTRSTSAADRPSVRRRERRWPRSLLRPMPVAGAACALLLAGLGAGLLVSSDGSEDARTVVAQVSGEGMRRPRPAGDRRRPRRSSIVDGMRSAGRRTASTRCGCFPRARPSRCRRMRSSTSTLRARHGCAARGARGRAGRDGQLEPKGGSREADDASRSSQRTSADLILDTRLLASRVDGRRHGDGDVLPASPS